MTDWLDAEDAAARCGVSKGTVYGWIRKGKVTAKTSDHFRGGRYLVDMSTVPEGYRPVPETCIECGLTRDHNAPDECDICAGSLMPA